MDYSIEFAKRGNINPFVVSVWIASFDAGDNNWDIMDRLQCWLG